MVEFYVGEVAINKGVIAIRSVKIPWILTLHKFKTMTPPQTSNALKN